MKSFKLLATAALLLGSITLATSGFAGERGNKYHGGHDGWGYGKGGTHLVRFLDLTDTQKETLKAQRESNKTANDALRAKIVDTRDALEVAIDAGANDAELAALAETLGKLHAEQVLAGAKAHKSFVAILTDEQKQKLADIKAKREARRNNHTGENQNSSVASGT